MTEEEIKREIAKAISEVLWRDEIIPLESEAMACASAALTLAKPLIEREERRRTIEKAMEAARRWYEDDPPSGGMIDGTVDGLRAAIQALSDPEAAA